MAATTPTSGIPFAIALEPQPIRLIELPPLLLSEIEDKGSTLELKSISGNSSGNAVLCSPTQTFSVRQNQSSNSLFITEVVPASSASTHIFTEASGSSTSAQLNAFARPRGMLEITPSRPDAVNWLLQRLPVMDREDMLSGVLPGDDADPDGKVGHQRRSKDEYRREAPFSVAEFDNAFRQVGAFETSGSKSTLSKRTAFIPTPALALAAWREIGLSQDSSEKREGSEGQSSMRWVARISADHELPEPLIQAVLALVSIDSGVCTPSDTGTGQASTASAARAETRAVIDRDRCVAWVGDMLLLSSNGKVGGAGANASTVAGIPRTQLLAEWEALVPAAWRARVALSRLTVQHTVSNVDRGKGKDSEDDDGDDGSAAMVLLPPATFGGRHHYHYHYQQGAGAAAGTAAAVAATTTATTTPSSGAAAAAGPGSGPGPGAGSGPAGKGVHKWHEKLRAARR